MIHRLCAVFVVLVLVAFSVWFDTQFLLPQLEWLPLGLAILAIPVINWAASVIAVFLAMAVQDITKTELIFAAAFWLRFEAGAMTATAVTVVVLSGGGIILLMIALSSLLLATCYWIVNGDSEKSPL